MTAPEIPVSWGELIDKITILEIKSDRLANETARSRVSYELALLRAKLPHEVAKRADVRTLTARLGEVNGALWDIEDRIREKEADAEFDAEFIQLARSVYKTNDERAAIKRKINDVLNSKIVEEKSYRGLQQA
jgi:uncharacterized protein DUF6165